MSIPTKKQFTRGIILRPDDEALLGVEGELKAALTSKKLQTYINGALRNLVTEDDVATLTNKTIDADTNTIANLEVDNLKAGVLDTDLSSVSSLDDTIPSAKAVKAYVDTVAAAQNEASEIAYDHTSSSLIATTTQAAIDELDSTLDAEILRATAAENTLQTHIDTEASTRTTADNTLQTNLDTHVNKVTGAHAASAISVTAITGVTGSNVQAVAQDLKTQITSEASTRFTNDNTLQTNINTVSNGLSSHLSSLAAHGAETIIVTPSGNLSSGRVSDALNELQSDIDTRATTTALNTHTTDTTNPHAVTKVQVGLGNVDNTSDATKNSAVATLTNKTLTAPVINSPTGIVKADVGLSNVDNTSDATKNAATATLTNKTLTAPVINNGSATGTSIITPARADVKQDTKANLTTYATTATNGQFVFATDTKEMLQVVDGALVAVGSGGGGVTDVDVMLVQNFDAASTADFTQTGLGFNAVTPIHGVQSAQFIHQGAINQSAKQVVAVDRKFRGQTVQLSLNVRSTATEGNVTLLVTDETNAATIAASQSISTGSFTISATTTSASTTISGLSNLDANKLSVGMAVSGAGIANNTNIISINSAAGTAVLSIAATASATVTLNVSPLPSARTFSFTIPTNCSSLSYTITALPEANTPRTTIDDLVIRLASTALLSTSVVVPVTTSWQSYTPTFQGFGTPTNVEAQWRQNGENHEYRIKFSCGTTTAVEARIGLANGATSASATLIPSISTVGIVGVNASSTPFVALIEPSVTYFTLGQQVGTGSGAFTKINGNNTLVSGSQVSFSASVPVSGLSSTTTKTIKLTQAGLIQDADCNLHITNFTPAMASTNTAILSLGSSYTTVKNVGDHISWGSSTTLGDTFTATKTGIYTFSFSMDTGTVAANIGLSKNSNQLTTNISSTNDKLFVGLDSGTSASATGSWSGLLTAGDVIRLHGAVGALTSPTSSYSSLSITYQGSLKQVSVNTNQKATIPTHELRLEGSSSLGTGAETAIIKFTSQTKLKGDGLLLDNSNGTKITVQKAGRLSVTSSIIILFS
jgi:hypothetical protein